MLAGLQAKQRTRQLACEQARIPACGHTGSCVRKIPQESSRIRIGSGTSAEKRNHQTFSISREGGGNNLQREDCHRVIQAAGRSREFTPPGFSGSQNQEDQTLDPAGDGGGGDNTMAQAKWSLDLSGLSGNGPRAIRKTMRRCRKLLLRHMMFIDKE